LISSVTLGSIGKINRHCRPPNPSFVLKNNRGATKTRQAVSHLSLLGQKGI
jgi:hypothetical protein